MSLGNQAPSPPREVALLQAHLFTIPPFVGSRGAIISRVDCSHLSQALYLVELDLHAGNLPCSDSFLCFARSKSALSLWGLALPVRHLAQAIKFQNSVAACRCHRLNAQNPKASDVICCKSADVARRICSCSQSSELPIRATCWCGMCMCMASPVTK